MTDTEQDYGSSAESESETLLQCSVCKEQKPAGSFYKDKRSLTGYTCTCRSCHRQQLKDSRRRVAERCDDRVDRNLEQVQGLIANGLVKQPRCCELCMGPAPTEELVVYQPHLNRPQWFLFCHESCKQAICDGQPLFRKYANIADRREATLLKYGTTA